MFAAGTGYIDWMARADAGRWSFVPGLVVAGIGLGFTWVPAFSLGTRDLRPELAGVASGIFSTIQELGAVLASAAVGALLQNRLALALHAQAVQRATQLPAPVRASFVTSFNTAAQNGLAVGQGQTGGSLHAPAGVSAQVLGQMQRLAETVFTHGFADALRPTLVLPLALILLAAFSCLAVKSAAPQRAAAVARPELLGAGELVS